MCSQTWEWVPQAITTQLCLSRLLCWVARQEGSQFEHQLGTFVPMLGFFWILPFPPTVHKHDACQVIWGFSVEHDSQRTCKIARVWACVIVCLCVRTCDRKAACAWTGGIGVSPLTQLIRFILYIYREWKLPGLELHTCTTAFQKTGDTAQHSHSSVVVKTDLVADLFRSRRNLNVCYWQLQFILGSQDSVSLMNRLPMAWYLSLHSLKQHY